jgi:hypothetical protein
MKKYLIWIPFIGILYFSKFGSYKIWGFWMFYQILIFSTPMALLLGKIFFK